ncbi:EAL domain-containing protein [Microbacterium sp. NPDC019599]|uniref:putative bifunctional diguanylate cyclase/phosphodiesterase n=1 Tax=Microbacterium sp. NPDC019599 TaxID=3154690 RepID=UPI0033EFB47E
MGDGILIWFARVQAQDAFPTAADLFYVAAYPLFAVGLAQLIRARRPLDDQTGFIDSGIVTAGLVLVWVLLAEPRVADTDASSLGLVLSVAYPIADIVLLGMLIGLITVPGGRSAATALLVLGVAALIVADLGATALGLHNAANTDFDPLWLASYALWGSAALHPSMRTLSERAIESRGASTNRWAAAFAITTFVALVGLTVKRLLGLPIDGWLVGVVALVMMSMALARMKIALNQSAKANEALRETQKTLAHQAAHDALTGLPNRARAVQLITAAMSGAAASGSRVALLFLDLDGFKRVNDTLGHDAGDDLLRVVAGRLRDNVRAGDIACRLGGDEFLILLAPLTEEADAVAVAERLVPALAAPVAVADGQTAAVGVSIGVALSQGHETTPDMLLKEADQAVYKAKRSGRGRVSIFDAEMRREVRAHANLERDLGIAIAGDRLVLHYQPIVHLGSGAVQGFEALVRWPHYGMLLPPSAFVPIAEQSELVCELGAWVLRRATQQLAAWNESPGSPRLSVTVNVSGQHVSRPRVLDDVRSAVAASGIDPAQLVLEITETSLIDDSTAVEHLDELRRDGISIAIDDFGTGYSSIARLEDLPIDVLKIDRRFIETTRAQRLLRVIVETGHALGLGVIAEGVETEDHVSLLRSVGCDSAQGYLLGRPTDPDAIAIPGQQSAPRLARVGTPAEPSRVATLTSAAKFKGDGE